MMNKKRLMAILAAGVLTATSFNPVMIKAESVSAEEAGMAVPADQPELPFPQTKLEQLYLQMKQA